MRSKNNSDNDKTQLSKEKILEAAIEVFSEKGFDGSRVDEIAIRANVNKAMLYYYFESKEKLFEELVKNYKEEVKALKEKLLQENIFEDDEKIEPLFEGLYSFMEKKKNVLRIIMIESLKSTSQDVTIFSSLLPTVELKVSKLKNKGVEVEDAIGLMINSFFFMMIPAATYLVLGDRWSEFYGFGKEEAKKRFLDIFKYNRNEYFKRNLKTEK